MEAKAVGKTTLRCLFVGSLSICDTEIERRPYHWNCGCALHDSKRVCPMADCQQRNHTNFHNLAFPKKECWNHCSVSLVAATSKLSSSPLSYRKIRDQHHFKESSWQR